MSDPVDVRFVLLEAMGWSAEEIASIAGRIRLRFSNSPLNLDGTVDGASIPFASPPKFSSSPNSARPGDLAEADDAIEVEPSRTGPPETRIDAIRMGDVKPETPATTSPFSGSAPVPTPSALIGRDSARQSQPVSPPPQFEGAASSAPIRVPPDLPMSLRLPDGPSESKDSADHRSRAEASSESTACTSADSKGASILGPFSPGSRAGFDGQVPIDAARALRIGRAAPDLSTTWNRTSFDRDAASPESSTHRSHESGVSDDLGGRAATSNPVVADSPLAESIETIERMLITLGRPARSYLPRSRRV